MESTQNVVKMYVDLTRNVVKMCEHPGVHGPHPYKEHPDEPPNKWFCLGVERKGETE